MAPEFDIPSALPTDKRLKSNYAPEALEGAIKAKFNILQKIDSSVESTLNSIDRVIGPSHAAQYKRQINYDQKLVALKEAIRHLNSEGHDVSELKGLARSLESSKDEYTKLIMERGSSADDKVAEETKDEPKVADDLVKDASFNAVFWGPEVKTPFGR